MRYCRVLQLFYKEKKRLVWSIRHIGYWKRRNCGNPIDIKKQYVSKGKKNKRIAFPFGTIKMQLANFCYWVVQKAKWEIRLQRV